MMFVSRHCIAENDSNRATVGSWEAPLPPVGRTVVSRERGGGYTLFVLLLQKPKRKPKVKPSLDDQKEYHHHRVVVVESQGRRKQRLQRPKRRRRRIGTRRRRHHHHSRNPRKPNDVMRCPFRLLLRLILPQSPPGSRRKATIRSGSSNSRFPFKRNEWSCRRHHHVILGWTIIIPFQRQRHRLSPVAVQRETQAFHHRRRTSSEHHPFYRHPWPACDDETRTCASRTSLFLLGDTEDLLLHRNIIIINNNSSSSSTTRMRSRRCGKAFPLPQSHHNTVRLLPPYSHCC